MMMSAELSKAVHQKIIAISYQLQNKGKYSGVVRNFLQKGIDKYIRGLNEEERKRYNALRERVLSGEEREPREVAISFYGPDEIRTQLITISRHMGCGGSYVWPLHKFLSAEADEYICSLEGKDRKVFDEILDNVKIRETMK